MNLLCPSCQNPLTVPEQYAGQLMKCPLCNNNFTVPALPASTPAAPSPAPPPSSPPTPALETYGVAADPVLPAAPPSAAPSLELAPTLIPGAMPALPSIVAPAAASTPASPAPPAAPAGYTRKAAFALNPRVVPWIAPICLFVVFVLTFFPWVGYFPGGYGVLTQSAWGAAFGGYSVDKVFDSKMEWEKSTKDDEKPGAGVLLIFFLLALAPAVLLGAAAVALPRIKGQVKLPPVATRLEPFRWLLTTAVTLIALLFLLLQLLTGFSLEARTRDKIDKASEAARKAATPEGEKFVDIQDGMKLGAFMMHRTLWLRLSFFLLVLAALGAGTAHWLEQRGPNRPLPRFEAMW